MPNLYPKTLTHLAAMLLWCGTVTGCDRAAAPAEAPTAAPSKTSGQAALPPNHPPTRGGAAGQAAPAGTVSGTVLETMNSGGYTYLRLQTKQGEQWAAVTQATVAKGAQVELVSAMLMRGFHSKTLDRTFPTIWFAQLGGSAGQPTSQPTSQPASRPTAKPAAPSGPIAVTTPAGVEKIAQLWARRASLAGKKTRVHGKVVKYNGGVMGKNWIHLQDGSGDAAQGTHDLTVTTQSVAKVGDELTLEGVAQVEKDFGAGYRYAFIIEDAKVVPAP